MLADADVQYVVVGLDRELTYQKLTTAVRLVRGGRRVRRAEPGHDAAHRRRHHPRRRLVPGGDHGRDRASRR